MIGSVQMVCFLAPAAIDLDSIGRMPKDLLILQAAVGLVAGLAVAGLYFLVLHRQAGALASGKPTLLAMGGYLIRLLLVVGSVVGMLLWGLPAGIACALAFIIAQRIALFMIKKKLPGGE